MENQFDVLLAKQREFFFRGETLSIKFRKNALSSLMKNIKTMESDILNALKTDLGKSEFEGYSNEIGIVYLEIKHLIKNIKKWSSKKRTKLEMYLLPASGTIYKEPYGNTLIIAPWNYPFQLLITPLIASISAGNTAIVKPSELAPATAKVLTNLIENTFKPEYVSIVNGGIEETTKLLKLKMDKIFFTGSVPVGKVVMEAASKNLTPLTLELGGKSPVIVDKTANLKLAAKKIVWGKFNNAGQTCVAPDYILVDKAISKELVNQIVITIKEFYGENPKNSKDFGRIINNRHFERLMKLIDKNKIAFGGDSDSNEKYISPTVMTNVELTDMIMQDEIFGPILPVMEYENIEDAVNVIRGFTKPLSLYLFTSDKKNEEYIMKSVSFGGGGINCTILHVASSHLPFGGVGHSGMGNYHGKAGFDCFSHTKSILKQSSILDPGLVYPGKQIPLSLIKKIMG